ncbi:hypothetical protein DBR32_05945 [Taibaiella sp. KBW10]|uniref:Ig-like domain-containing protein n=1 Tax=Taibaiella sp. KBW10 TaxID=2153357 RepID=UPI000F5A43ED|nr:PKD domain-containing protein [Taibaiella sp. KBW10]RQO31498.1 hypothetical protein DBR32_05945 [Taibaiella sp. KBW10]
MRKNFLLVLALLFAVQYTYAAYVPLNISSGYSADVVVNGIGTGLATTTSDVDGVSYAFVAQGWQQTAASTPLAWGFPASGIVNSTVAATPGLSFNLASYNSNNSVRIAANGTGATVAFANTLATKKMFLLMTSGSGTSYFTGQVNFTDGTNQPISTDVIVPDWFNSTAQPVALQGFGRINRSTDALESNATEPRLYQITVAILPANQSKLVASIQLTKSNTSDAGSVINVFAVSSEITTTNDAGITSLTSPVYFCAGANDIKVKVKNFGNNVLNNVQIQWQLNGTTQTPFNLSLPLDTIGGAGINEREVLLGNYTFTNVPVTFKAWSTLPNGVADGFTTNDTFRTNIQSSLSGVYTINSASATGGTNYASFGAFSTALSTYGVCGPVTANVVPTVGIYNELVQFGNIPGASNVNRIRINGNGANVQFTTTTNAGERHMLLLNGTKYLRIDSVNFKSLSTSVAWGALITNGCRYDSITNCTFDNTLVTAVGSATNCGIVFSSSNSTATSTGMNGASCYIYGNKLLSANGTGGMYYGIAISGGGNDSNIVKNNLIENFYFYAIYLSATTNNLIDGNIMHRTNKTTSFTTTTGIYTTGDISNTKLINNRVYRPGGTAGNTSIFYGFQLLGDGTATQPIIVANNLFYNLNQGGTLYGLYFSTALYNKVYHNTVLIDQNLSSTSLNYGIYATGANTATEFKNNILSITAGGTSTKYGFYYNTATSVADAQKNDVYINTTQAGTANYGYLATAYLTQAAFQTAFPAYEIGSPIVDPQFVSAVTANYTPTNLAVVGTGANTTALVPADINGLLRPATPTLGAFEAIVASPNNTSLPALMSPTGNFCSGVQQVKVVIKNSGTNNISTAQINWKVNGVVQTPFAYTGTLVPVGSATGNNTDTVVIGSYSFNTGVNPLQVWTTLPNGGPDSDPTNDTLNAVLTPAVFSITATADTICGTGLDTLKLFPATGYAANALQWDVSINGGASWTSIAGANTNTYVVSGMSAQSCYRVRINTGGTNCYSPVKCIQFATVAILSTTPGSRCGTGSVNLSATAQAGNNIKWFTAITGGTAIGTGASFATPSIATNTTYYAEASLGNTTVGCASTRTAVLATVNPAPVVNLGNDTFICGTGTINLNATNTGATYLWSTGATTANISVTTPGTYHVAVTGTNTCVKRDTIVIAAGVNPTNILPATANLCQGASLNLSAGNAGSAYLWNTGATTQTLTITAPGTYNVKITNAQGCSLTTPGTVISTIAAPVLNLGNDTAICTNTTLTLNATNAGASYSWNTGATTPTLAVTAAGTYRVLVTGANTCTKRDTIIVTTKPSPTDVLPATHNLCQGSSFTLNAGNPGASYLWNTGATTQSITVTSGGTYTATITNTQGCTKTTAGTVITMRPLPVVNLGADTIICNNAPFTLNAGNAGSTYLWSTGATGQTIAPTTTGNYNVTVTNTYTCKGSDTIHVDFYDDPTVDGFNFVPMFNVQPGLVHFNPINPQSVTTYAWDFGDGTPISNVMSPDHQYLQSGDYNITLRVSNDCGSVDTNLRIEVNLLTSSVKQKNRITADIMVYPNPSRDGSLTIENKAPEVKLNRIQVYTLLGSLVYDAAATAAPKQQISFGHVASGTYLISIETDKGSVIRKIEVIK